MSFPEIKKRWFAPDELVGWEDRGEIGVRAIPYEKPTIDTCNYCYSVIHIGIENHNLFKFCPKCMIKINNK